MLHDRVLPCGEPSYGTLPRPDPAGARLSGRKIGTRVVSGQGRSVGARISQRERILRAMVTFFPETGLPGAASFLAVGRCQAAALLLQRHSPCRPGGAEDAAVARLPRD